MFWSNMYILFWKITRPNTKCSLLYTANPLRANIYDEYKNFAYVLKNL